MLLGRDHGDSLLYPPKPVIKLYILEGSYVIIILIAYYFKAFQQRMIVL